MNIDAALRDHLHRPKFGEIATVRLEMVNDRTDPLLKRGFLERPEEDGAALQGRVLTTNLAGLARHPGIKSISMVEGTEIEVCPPVDVYVPTKEPYARLIAAGAAVVGKPLENDRVIVYYEGNLSGASNLNTFEEKLDCVAGRMVSRYPTAAMSMMPKDALAKVGTFDVLTKTFVIEDAAALEGWAQDAVAQPPLRA